jgi:hypothetical protein
MYELRDEIESTAGRLQGAGASTIIPDILAKVETFIAGMNGNDCIKKLLSVLSDGDLRKAHAASNNKNLIFKIQVLTKCTYAIEFNAIAALTTRLKLCEQLMTASVGRAFADAYFQGGLYRTVQFTDDILAAIEHAGTLKGAAAASAAAASAAAAGGASTGGAMEI